MSEDLQEVDLGGADSSYNGSSDNSRGSPSEKDREDFMSPKLVLGKSSGDPFGSSRDPNTFSREDLPRIAAMLVVCLMAVCFWAVFEQQGNTLAQFADGEVNRRITFFGKDIRKIIK